MDIIKEQLKQLLMMITE